MTDETTVATEAQATPEAGGTEAATSEVNFDSYINTLPEGDRELLTKNGVDSFEKQGKFINHLNTQLGKKGLIPPADDASDEDKQKFKDDVYNTLGRPEDGVYDFDLPEGSNDKYYTDEFLNGLAGVAFDSGVSAEGFQKLVDFMGTNFNEVVKEFENKFSEISKKLGEDKVDDGANATSTVSKDSVRDQARVKKTEARTLHKQGKFAEAKRMDKEANELYTKLESFS